LEKSLLPTALSEQLRAVAISAVEKLLRVCADHESGAWLSNYRRIHEALQRQRDEEAIRFEGQAQLQFPSGAQLDHPRWVVSERLAEDFRKTIARLRTHLMYDDQRPPLTVSKEVPDIEAEGTREQRSQERAAQFAASVQHDPIEHDPKSKVILEAAEREAEDELANVPRGLGFCQRFWRTKQRILKEKYGLSWKTPDEMNPHIIFD
jgi:hypothetical protein